MIDYSNNPKFGSLEFLQHLMDLPPEEVQVVDGMGGVIVAFPNEGLSIAMVPGLNDCFIVSYLEPGSTTPATITTQPGTLQGNAYKALVEDTIYKANRRAQAQKRIANANAIASEIIGSEDVKVDLVISGGGSSISLKTIAGATCVLFESGILSPLTGFSTAYSYKGMLGIAIDTLQAVTPATINKCKP